MHGPYQTGTAEGHEYWASQNRQFMSFYLTESGSDIMLIGAHPSWKSLP